MSERERAEWARDHDEYLSGSITAQELQHRNSERYRRGMTATVPLTDRQRESLTVPQDAWERVCQASIDGYKRRESVRAIQQLLNAICASIVGAMAIVMSCLFAREGMLIAAGAWATVLVFMAFSLASTVGRLRRRGGQRS